MPDPLVYRNVNCEIYAREFQFIGVGGLPMPSTRDPRERADARARFQETVIGLVEDKLRERGQTLPPGLRVVWASVVQGLPNGFVRIPAVRIYPITGRTARDYIDAMLDEQEPEVKAPVRALPAPSTQEPVAH
jgi:hypothetical protein